MGFPAYCQRKSESRKNQTDLAWWETLGQLALKVSPRLFSTERDLRDMEFRVVLDWIRIFKKRHVMTTGENEYGPGNR